MDSMEDDHTLFFLSFISYLLLYLYSLFINGTIDVLGLLYYYFFVVPPFLIFHFEKREREEPE